MRTQDMPIVSLPVDAFERGRRHGNLFRDSIARLIRLQDQQLAASTGEDARQKARAEKETFLAQSRHLEAIEEWAPDLLLEIRGIADGAGVEFNEILFLNLADEHWSYTAQKQAVGRGGACSAFGVVSQRGLPPWSGQNMDVGRWLEGFQTLFRIEGADAGVVASVFSHPGLIGLCGMNSAPIGIACNSLLTLNAENEGLPVAFIVRRFLEHANFDDAVSFLQKIPHASGQNYVVSSPTRVRSFEASAGGVAEYRPDPEMRRVCHTNHPLASDDLNGVSRAPTALSSTHARLASISARLGDSGKRISLSDIKAALSAHDDPLFPVSRRGDYDDHLTGYTLASLVYELSSAPRLHIAAGPPCQTEWITLPAGRNGASGDAGAERRS